MPSADSGPPSELQQRRNKFAQFETHCSEVGPGIFLSGDAVAKSRERLQAAGITHVVNCVGQLYPNYFAAELKYLKLHLMGAPGPHGFSLLDLSSTLAQVNSSLAATVIFMIARPTI